jgi:class 3 adenylate cyclase
MTSNEEYNLEMDSRLLEKNDAREMMRDPIVLQALQLAERMREVKGDDLDSDEYFAISEATGVSEEYLRFLEQTKTSSPKHNFLDRLRTQFFGLDSDTRRYVSSGLLATVFALLLAVGFKLDTITSIGLKSSYSVFQSMSFVVGLGAIYNAAASKSIKAAALIGGIFGGMSYILGSIFAMVFFIPKLDFPPSLTLVCSLCCALLGMTCHFFGHLGKKKPGSLDRNVARQDMLKQLVDLQEHLREGQQAATFLSLDVVGSTKMKLNVDPLAVEFTFTEYHNYVARIAEKHFGNVHSTAGDGITVAFDNPQNAFSAARQIQTGLVEFNAFRNKIGIPLQLRAGIHTGQVVAPEAGNMTSINFASVIDIAAHLQKECPIGGVAISDEASVGVTGGASSIGTERVCVHDTWATVWKRKKSLDAFKMPEVATQN